MCDSESGPLPHWQHPALGLEQGTPRRTFSSRPLHHLQSSPGNVSNKLRISSWRGCCPLSCSLLARNDWRGALGLGQLCPLRQESSVRENVHTIIPEPFLSVSTPGYLAGSAASVTQSSPRSQARTSPINHVKSEFPSVPDRL